MAFSMTNVLNSLVEATTRSPRPVKLTDEQDLYKHRPQKRPSMNDIMAAEPTAPVSGADSGKSGEQLEHDTLARIRDALYRDQQS